MTRAASHARPKSDCVPIAMTMPRRRTYYGIRWSVSAADCSHWDSAPGAHCLDFVGKESDWDLLPRGANEEALTSLSCVLRRHERPACMSLRHLRLYIAASATSLTLLSGIVAGTSPRPSALLLAVIVLVPPIIMPLWLRVPAIAPAGTERRS